MGILEVEPEFRASAKIRAKPQRRISCDVSPLTHNVADTIAGNANDRAKLPCAKTQRNHELFSENFPGMGSYAHHDMLPSLIINNFDMLWAPGAPMKTQSPLVIDPNAPLPRSGAGQFFQPIARWKTKDINTNSCIQHIQFAACDRFDAQPAGITNTFDIKSFSDVALKRKNHCNLLSEVSKDTKRRSSLSDQMQRNTEITYIMNK